MNHQKEPESSVCQVKPGSVDASSNITINLMFDRRLPRVPLWCGIGLLPALFLLYTVLCMCPEPIHRNHSDWEFSQSLQVSVNSITAQFVTDVAMAKKLKPLHCHPFTASRWAKFNLWHHQPHPAPAQLCISTFTTLTKAPFLCYSLRSFPTYNSFFLKHEHLCNHNKTIIQTEKIKALICFFKKSVLPCSNASG